MIGTDVLLDVERALLGGILWAPDASLPSLLPDEWGLDRHRRIWRAMLDASDGHTGADLALVTSHLQAAGELEEVGGRGYLAGLIEAGEWAVPGLWTRYATAIRHAAARRNYCALATTILSNGGLERAAIEERLAEIPEVVPAGQGDLWAEIEAQWGAGRVHLGLSSLDKLIGGLLAGDLVVIGARPSNGKTALLVSATLSLLTAGHRVTYLSLETPALGIYRRLVAARGQVRIVSLRNGWLSQSEYQIARECDAWLSVQSLAIRDAGGLGGKDAPTILRAINEEPSEIVMLDHLQEVLTDDHDTRALALSQFVGRLKEAAVRRGKVLFLAAQLSRLADGKERPMLAGLKDSGGIEEKADVVLLLDYRVKRDAQAPPEQLDAYVAKHRDGPTGHVALRILPQYGLVSDA